MKTSDAMSVDEALKLADEHTQNFKEHASKIVSTLAAEVRRLRKEKSENMAQIQGLRVNSDDEFALGFHRAVVEVLQILRGE